MGLFYERHQPMLSVSCLMFLNSAKEVNGSITLVLVWHQKRDSRGNGFAQHAGIFNERFSKVGKKHTTCRFCFLQILICLIEALEFIPSSKWIFIVVERCRGVKENLRHMTQSFIQVQRFAFQIFPFTNIYSALAVSEFQIGMSASVVKRMG